MHLGQRDGQRIPCPRFLENPAVRWTFVVGYADRFYIGIAVAPVAAETRRRVQTLVEISIARQVVVEAHYVRRAGMVKEPVQLGGACATLHQPVPQWMMLGYTPSQDIDRQPAPVVLELRLRDQAGAAVDVRPASSVCISRAHGLISRIPRHPERGRSQLVEQGPDERAVVAVMRIPVSVTR